jgi:hypothetical protein
VKAISEKARISGLLVQKVEVGGPGAFEECNSVEEVADELIRFEAGLYRHVTAEEHAALSAGVHLIYI